MQSVLRSILSDEYVYALVCRRGVDRRASGLRLSTQMPDTTINLEPKDSAAGWTTGSDSSVTRRCLTTALIVLSTPLDTVIVTQGRGAAIVVASQAIQECVA